MKKGKEIKVDTFKNYSVSIGSTNYKNPTAIYVDISAWGEPDNDVTNNYNRIIRDINKAIRQEVYTYLSANDTDLVSDRYIVDLDVRESGIRFGKRSFTNCEITLFIGNNIIYNADKIRYHIDKLIHNVINNCLDRNKYFKFYRRKK